MRRNIFALGALVVLAVLVVVSQADALQAQKAYKEMTITVTVTPSPAPPSSFVQPPAAAATAQVAALLADPPAGPAQIAYAGPSWDVAPGGGIQIAQVQVQPTPVPVQFVAKADPNAAYLHIVPHTPSLNAGYGQTVFTCVFEIYTFYTTIYSLTDWGYGTLKTGATPYFPIMNYPTTSDLSWTVPDLAPTKVTPYNNSGPPGETTWTGTANQAQQHCINLTLNIPNSQPPGIYTATIQYNLYVNL
ncbi:MAG TPA: hypothetical protein VHT05_01470 [Candidatus Elarobacter sp.]|nr:hypothetical protein [Candidatus Elarobacter sp.]